MNVMYLGKVFRLRPNVIIAIQKINGNLKLPPLKLEKFINDSLLIGTNKFLETQKSIKKIPAIKPAKIEERMTPRLTRLFNKARADYKKNPNDRKKFSPAFSNAKDAINYLNSL